MGKSMDLDNVLGIPGIYVKTKKKEGEKKMTQISAQDSMAFLP